tara:strand:+ start:5132 stop:6364 length:1233 start_codon:yes stop_codon:yes gene_type:complete
MSDLLFFAGGECVSRHGTIVWRESEAQDNASTFTRAGAVETYVGGSGRVVKADANIPRVSWNDGTPSLLIEKSFTNLVSSDNFDSGWSDEGGAPTVAATTDPAGGSTAYSITDSDGSAARGKKLTCSFTDDGTKGIVFVVRDRTAPGSGGQQIGVKEGSTWRMLLTITWSNGVPSVTATNGTYLGQRYVGNGYYAIYGAAPSVDASETNTIQLFPAATASQTGAFDVYRVNAYNAVVPPYSIFDTGVTSETETFYADFVAPPQAMTVYAKFQDAGTLASSTQGIVHIGGSGATTGARFQILSPSASAYGVLHGNGVDASITANITSSAVWANVVELRGVLNADGSILIGQSLDSGTETTNSTATIRSLASAWNDSRIYIGSRGAATQGVGVYQAVKVARGVKTMAEMRAL